MKRARNLTLLLGALLALGPITAAQAAHKPKPAGPSLKITALSVNENPFAPGTKVTESEPENACYYVFGEAASPHEMLLTALAKASGIRGAPRPRSRWKRPGPSKGSEKR